MSPQLSYVPTVLAIQLLGSFDGFRSKWQDLEDLSMIMTRFCEAPMTKNTLLDAELAMNKILQFQLMA
jgi:hypothetical protein